MVHFNKKEPRAENIQILPKRRYDWMTIGVSFLNNCSFFWVFVHSLSRWQFCRLVPTYVVESSFGQLFWAHRYSWWPVNKREAPVFALLHGRVGHAGEGKGSWRCSRRQCCRPSDQWHIVSSVPTDKPAVGIMSLVLGHSSVTWLPVTQLQRRKFQLLTSSEHQSSH